MKCFKSDSIVFYTLFLSAQEREIQTRESLRDFLEAKICLVLNLPKDREYILRYVLSSTGDAYHCVLLDKEALVGYVSSAQEFLSHPCFLCARYVKNGYALIKDAYLSWVFVGFEGGNIIEFYAAENLATMHKKLESCREFWLWEIGKITQEEQAILADFQIDVIQKNLEDVELLEDDNFNPLERPLSLQHTKKALLSLVAGVGVGFALWVGYGFTYVLEQRKNTNVELQIGRLQEELATLSQSRTQAQNALLDLQERLKALQAIYALNAESLKPFGVMDFQAVQFLYALRGYLENFNVKVAYFGVEEERVAFLLRGAHALKVLEAVEKNTLGSIEIMGSYGEFVWCVVKGNKHGSF